MPKPSRPKAPIGPSHPCAFPDCDIPAECRAPRSRDRLDDYMWMCQLHAREYNARWDYFKDMSEDEIEEFRREALTGHRPTWKIGAQPAYAFQRSEDILRDYFEMPRRKAPLAVPHKECKAMETLEMEWPLTEKDLKARYRVLVKRWHPDANQGDKTAEETFKGVKQAYETLKSWLKKQG